MSFRQIFDRIARLARAEMNGSRSSSYEEELRRAERLIEESRRGRRTTIEEDPAGTVQSDDVEYMRALAIIGVAPGSTREQIAAAYRARARAFHPDRVSHLSEEEQRAALARMQELNLAYEYLERRGQR